LVCLWATWWFWQRSRAPYMRLDADGFVVHGATGRIPWTAVQDIHFTQVNQIVTMEFLLEEAHTLVLGRGHRRRASWNAKKHILRVSAAGAKTLKSAQLAELIVDYYRAGHARALQAERAAARAPTTAPESPSV
jgi:hypothetical protein